MFFESVCMGAGCDVLVVEAVVESEQPTKVTRPNTAIQDRIRFFMASFLASLVPKRKIKILPLSPSDLAAIHPEADFNPVDKMRDAPSALLQNARFPAITR
jgi:hypothetical protein